MATLVGRKVGMIQIFGKDDALVPVTIIQAGPCPVVQVKEEAVDGYRAVRIGYEDIPSKRVNRPDAGVFEKSGLEPKRILREFRLTSEETYQIGDILDVAMFEDGDQVDVTGCSKGKGFAGVVRRHHFKGGPKTHGQSDRHRAPGSIGQSSYPSRVFKGVRMGGRMGNRRVTTKGLSVVRIDKERNLLFIKGSVPGARGGVVSIRKAG